MRVMLRLVPASNASPVDALLVQAGVVLARIGISAGAQRGSPDGRQRHAPVLVGVAAQAFRLLNFQPVSALASGRCRVPSGCPRFPA